MMTAAIGMKGRVWGAAALALALAGCSGKTAVETDPGNGGIAGMVMRRASPAVLGLDEEEAARLVAANAPQVATYMVDRGGSVLMLKAGERAGVARWRSADNRQFYLRDGMIVGTRGLGFDLMSADPGATMALVRAERGGQTNRVHRYLDGEGRLYIRSYVCDIAPGAVEAVQIPGGAAVQARRITETCHSPGGGFTNAYWLRGGRLVQTRQFISDGIGRAQLIFMQ